MGKLLIYSYLPQQMVGEVALEEVDIEEFYKWVALAQYAREMRVNDMAEGVAKALQAAFGGDS